jgi:IS4 transposase
MRKSKFFTGQPLFNQLLKHIPRNMVHRVSREFNSDRYCKSFKTYDHLVTMLYASFNQCTSLREVTTGLLAWEQRIHHLGLAAHPRRSTIADANKRRDPQVFEQIYLNLWHRYKDLLPDSRSRSKNKRLYLFDSTTITLFQDILKGAGLSQADGRRKGGIKAHTLLHAATNTPAMVWYSPAANNDTGFLKLIQLPAGSIVAFDKGFRDYKTYNRFTQQKITWITRYHEGSVYQLVEKNTVSEKQKKRGIVSDWQIKLGHTHNNSTMEVPARMIHYYDSVNKRIFCFMTNNHRFNALTIADFYAQRWQIETFFKQIKQNYPLKYFLGDNEHAIQIQIWCALIADLLLKVVRQGSRSKMAYSNLVGLVRLHLMTYINLNSFLRAPEKSLLRQVQTKQRRLDKPSLFSP